MDNETRKALEDVVTYLWDDEAADYAEHAWEGAHVFESLQKLRTYLDGNPA